MENVVGSRHALRSVRRLTIIAQDPAFTVDGRILTAQVDVPAELTQPGPSGYRVKVVDYDATAKALYEPLELKSGLEGDDPDPYAGAADEVLLGDPRFHAQNAYAIAMRILARFELALGRRVPWGCAGHQLHIAPHAFLDANAFYSRHDRGLYFGYFAGRADGEARGGTIHTCLSHDIVAHETTHAILDGLRQLYLEPSSPDQAAFHEGFADVVALLSVFALEEVVGALLDGSPGDSLIDGNLLTREHLRDSALFGLAAQMGQERSGIRGDALRRSIVLPPGQDYMNDSEFIEEHRRGELLVAAMMNSFLDIWLKRLARVGPIIDGKRDRSLVVEEGAKVADHLMTIAIRAIDYCPPVDLTFSSYLSALLTIDSEVVPDDRYGYRQVLLDNFAAYGIKPSHDADQDGSWRRFSGGDLVYSRTHFDSMLRDEEEMFRFVWENRKALKLGDLGYMEVQSVRPSTRVAPDGFVLRETVAEYVQTLTMQAGELREIKVLIPEDIEVWRNVTLHGGGTLIFDEYGQLKYQIANRLPLARADARRHGNRIAHLHARGHFRGGSGQEADLAALHRRRGMVAPVGRGTR